MGQKLTAFILLLAVVGSTFNKAIVLADYSLNKTFIAGTLCENRNKPQSCCHGKCFLKKQLQKDENGKDGSTTIREKIDFLLFCEENSPKQNFVSPVKKQYFPCYTIVIPSLTLSSVFHPPA